VVDVIGSALKTAVGVPAAAYALAAIGLNVHYGYTGLLNFGQVAFMMVGAYGTAVTVTEGGPLWLGIIVGVGLAVVLGLVFGLPTLRLRADFLAITTIAAAEILRLLFRSSTFEPITRGVFGIQRFANSFYAINPIPEGQYGIGRFSFPARNLWPILVAWTAVAACTIFVRILMRTPWGRVLRGIRDDEDAVRSLGKDVFRFKLQSLILGGVVGSFAGMLLAIDTQAVNPDTYISGITFFAYTILVLGGAGTTLGPVVGAIVFWFILSLTDGLLTEYVPRSVLSLQAIASLRFALVGLALILLMAFRPQGMFGSREEAILGDR
jgi:neutral amino acid transport system permease protein